MRAGSDRKDGRQLCKVPGCLKTVHAWDDVRNVVGTCQRHYMAGLGAPRPTCGVVGCKRLVHAGALCQACYRKQRRNTLPAINAAANAACRRAYAKAPHTYAANATRRKRNLIGEFTEAEAQARWNEYQGCCAYCGAPAQELDHMVPVSAGGSNTIDNVVPACRPCNRSKHARPMLIFCLQKQLWGGILVM
jgi:5-methylcytosine-specific restriction endonuclease McrA